jgi:glucose/mannose transport system substrate-binding protein
MKALAISLSALMCANAVAGEVEVLHFWTSPGEAVSVTELKELMAQRKHTWKDFVVPGGGGGNAMQALKQRVLAGNPPASASIKGPAIQEWAALNTFANLDAMATFDHWDKILPKVVQDQVKHKGRYVAVPVNIHRANWLWSNAEVLKKSGVNAVPGSLEEFLDAAEKVRRAGFIPIAHGGQPWQEFLLFESIAIGVQGVDFYRQAFVKLDPAALNSADMRRVFEVFRRLKAYTDPGSKGRDWNAATEMVIKGRAAFQFMGDWAKGEFEVAGQKPGRDFHCSPAPGTARAFSYVIDTFAMFQLRGWEAQKAQGYLAYVLLGKEFQEKFNLRKGSLPARRDLDLSKFDDCAKASARDFSAGESTQLLVPSVAIDMAVPTATQAALRAVVSDYWNNDQLSASDAASRLLLAAHPKK